MTAVIIPVVSSPPASAWTVDTGRLQSYANSYWNRHNSAFPGVTDDCANFVSQVLWYGGMNFQGSPTGAGAHNISDQWWANDNSWTYSWTVADSQRLYLVNRKGYYPSYSHYGSGATNAPTGSKLGAVVFYNWGDDPAYPAPKAQHSAVVTYLNATDPSNTSYTGTLVHAHNDNHAKAIWHLRPYNLKWATTTAALYTW